MEDLISKATKNNWNKLKTNKKNKLTSRANKRLSTKKIIPIEYISHKENLNKVSNLIQLIIENKWSKQSAIYSLIINLLQAENIISQSNVKDFIEEYSYIEKIDELIKYNLMNLVKERDLMGLIYQCLMIEGEKNKKGSYYTPYKITEQMTKDLDFSNNQTFFDPCCGSGSYLMSLQNVNPEQIYGVDTDEIAVMIAKCNLLLKFKGVEFTPQIFKDNFLKKDNVISNKKFTYIITNPPWGAMTDKQYIPKEISSGEIFSCFIVKSFKNLEKDGKIRFLLPIAILNVKAHKDVREFILNNGNLKKITLYDDSFTGVVTKYVDIEVESKKADESVIVTKGEKQYITSKDNFKLTNNKVFTIIDCNNKNILEKIKNNGKYFLNNSDWALGIVTGDNKRKLLDKQAEGYEVVYTGKEIERYQLKDPKKYIKYDRNSFQQVAKDEYYRAPEKLVYKFISNKLTFAYDNNKSLFLNSANILIPRIPNMSIKTVMAYLNSEVFSYYYKNLFGEIKILKGNLMEIPFPDISNEENEKISILVDEVMNNKKAEDVLQNEIYKTYNLDKEEIEWV